MVQLGGFDTHADERETQQRLLQTLDEAVAAFLRDMSLPLRQERRRACVIGVRAQGGAQRVPGHRPRHRRAGVRRRDTVKGGFYGEEPSLTDLDNGDLKPTMDFRDVYYDLLAHTIGIDPTPSVGAGRTGMGFLG